MTPTDHDLDLLRQYAAQIRVSISDCAECRERDQVIRILRERLRACGDEQGPLAAPIGGERGEH